jgi:hypothetical protein
MKESDRYKPAFNLGPLGVFECIRLPFGLANACATFQRLMERCMDEINLRECLIYLDDIVIFSKTVEEQIERLESVFRKLRENGLMFKGNKCEDFRTEIKYMGFVVSEDGIKTDEEKVDAVRNWPEI